MDNTECPPVSYKCKRPAPRRNLVWEMESGNTFAGGYLHAILFYTIYIYYLQDALWLAGVATAALSFQKKII